MAEIRGSDKTGHKMAVFFLQKPFQAIGNRLLLPFRHQSEEKGHDVGRLCLSRHRSVFMEKGVLEFLHDMAI